MEEVKGDLMAACSYLTGSCKRQHIQALLSGGTLFQEGQGPPMERFRLNIRKIFFIRNAVRHRSRLSMEAVEFLLLEVFEIQTTLWLM